jgi:hypothetical protein
LKTYTFQITDQQAQQVIDTFVKENGINFSQFARKTLFNKIVEMNGKSSEELKREDVQLKDQR